MVPIEKDAVDGLIPIEVLARVAARMGSPTAPSPRYRSYSRCRTLVHCQADRSLLRCFGSIQCSIRFGMIRGSKNLHRARRRLRTNNAPLKREIPIARNRFCRVEGGSGARKLGSLVAGVAIVAFSLFHVAQ